MGEVQPKHLKCRDCKHPYRLHVKPSRSLGDQFACSAWGCHCQRFAPPLDSKDR